MAEPFVFEPARRTATNILAGLGGASGSGKTKSALELATGIGGKIALIDTEEGRSRHYATRYKFDVAQLGPPYTPERYIEAIGAARQHVGPGGVVIVDSMTHEWNGSGGMLEMADKFQQDAAKKWGGNPTKYTFMSWSAPKARHQKLVDYIIKLDCHLILCFRAKPKMKMVKTRENDSEVSTPVDVGIQPITDDQFAFEMTFFAIMDPRNAGVPVWKHKELLEDLRHVFPDGQQINVGTGKRLVQWAKGDDVRPIWVDKDGEKIGGPYERISQALDEFEKMWNSNKELVSNAHNYRTLCDFAPKVPDGKYREVVNEWATEMNDLLAKGYSGED
jgi:hypothetical protein